MKEIRPATNQQSILPLFYLFEQNNSGGNFIYDESEGITKFVVIQALSADEANFKASQIGIYFSGGGDCSCCGHRWFECDPEDASEVANIYTTPVSSYEDKYKRIKNGYEIFVHYLDGHIEGYFDNKDWVAYMRRIGALD